ncbi:MAG: ERF family protein [Desulfobacterales bacterium]|nr:ERF family protein [Desulfobacterales bacterium]MDD4072641.1 ERF family protein [Desulfobacterales bacterium]MDD4391463.1 ERF family protein [Desulfobacterales bacterium]
MESKMCSSEITALATAMIKVQQTLPAAPTDRENSFTKSRYATLNSVFRACRDALLSQGIWVTQYPVPVEQNHLGLVTKLVHAESGQWQSSLMVMPLPKNDPQGYGSAMTYARRYGLTALVGIVIENDDDGEAACPKRMSAKQTQNNFSYENRQHATGAKSNQRVDGPEPPGLPKLDGVGYQSGQSPSGKPCIVALGSTHSKKEFLRQAGFRWDGNNKIWWRHKDAA